MRWERLLDDLAASVQLGDRAARDSEVAERVRMEIARVTLTDRLRAATGRPLRLHVTGGSTLHGQLRRCGVDWMVIGAAITEYVVLLSAVDAIEELPRQVAAPMTAAAQQIFDGLDARFVLRAIATDRSPMRLTLTDGEVYAGTLDRVGADFLDLAVHPRGEPRRSDNLSMHLSVRLSAVAMIERASSPSTD